MKKVIFDHLRQYESLVRLKRQIWKGPRKNLSEFLAKREEQKRRKELEQLSAAQVSEIKQSLEEKNYTASPMVTITFGSRKFGNDDNKIELLFDSYLRLTRNPDIAEFLIKIDEDDDLPYFLELKKRYEKKINLRIFPSSRGRGYEDMHIWHHNLVKHRNSAARLHYILTDDAVFRHPNWDDNLTALMEKRTNTYFVGTACSFDEAITYYGPNPVEPVPVYWIRGDDYPIYGFDLLDSIKKVTQTFEDWTEFGNQQLVDQYAGALLETAWKKFGENIHEEIDLYAERKGGNVCWSKDPKRAEIRTRTLTEFHNDENKLKREKIIEQVLNDIKAATH